MKIIDLAEKQRNNEILPKHIRFKNEDLYFDGVTYYDEEGNNDLFDILAINNNALTHLYDEVEIIEEEKKIPEKLEELGKITYDLGFIDYKNIEVLKKYLNNDFQKIYDTLDLLIKNLNQLIDYLKSKNI